MNDKRELYARLNEQLAALMDERRHAVSTLANAAALIYGALENINWAGFYIMHAGALLLGPFGGKAACIDIPLGRGVCGTAASTGKTLVVPDVHAFKGHIACDSASASEIVVPIWQAGNVVGVLDIDSPVKDRFDDIDRAGLEAISELLGGLDYAHSGY